MNFYTRKLIKPEDLNGNNNLFGGRLLEWIDEEAFVYTMIQIGSKYAVTKFMSEINFVSSAKQGDVIEIGLKATEFGRTSITLTCEVRNKMTLQTILTIDKIVFVHVDADGNPKPHGRTEIRYTDDRLKEE